MNGAW